MTDKGADEAGRRTEQLARLQGIRSYVEDDDYNYLDLTGIYSSDPVAKTPFIVAGTFIPEEIGGTVGVVNADEDPEETLARENLNQMLNNFLPGGYKQRWGNFDLWRGNWNHESAMGHADIGPMFDWAESYPLTDLLGDVSEVEYTELPFEPEDVRVYVPLTIRVTEENKSDPNYVWIPEKGIVWTGDPPMTTEPLSSDPTTNYLWFKHIAGEFEGEREPVDSAGIISSYSFEDDCEFVRCYYGSLLTLYPADSTETRSEIMRYRCESDEKTAFVASNEQSQLLTFELDRQDLRSRLQSTLDSNPRLRRDLQFALLESNIWQRLFFDERALNHVYAVRPLVEHLLGIDYQSRVVDETELGVFELSGTKVADEVKRLLPDESDRHLRLLGHERRDVSDVFTTIDEHPGPIAELLARCRNDNLVMDFAERALVHSAEHALSTWANNLMGSGTSFELWYDVNFQETGDDTARIAVYDPIQGGAGIAKEVYQQLQANDLDIERGLAAQGRCHSATADRAAIELLANYPDGSLYDVYRNDHDEFVEMATDVVKSKVDDPDAYSMDDLVAHVEQRTRNLFETRELATFYSYVADEYTRVETAIGRTPRVVDLALHLNRHVFTDPEIKATYDRFADDSGRRDIAELGERLGELVVQCVTACPDCLKTETGLCLHGTGQQESRLNRRLLSEVFSQ
ncbi:hypothetical protein ACFQL1_16265 [Halomicroarcula sp. GCM10025709]|uniref:hypothetical protein n=1 Tax=Haloarcula TaxID=2237 RepID=UPI0024C43E21|nr:hypothetical protein [Halomicroarcula sp. YJ-61-S]